MRRWVWKSLWVVLASAIVFALTLSLLAEEQEIEQMRKDAEVAMQELRYRDALQLLEQIVAGGEATYEDRDRMLTCLIKLRERQQFIRKLTAFIEETDNPFDKGRHAMRLAALFEENRRSNRERLRALYPEVIGWLSENISSGERKATLADALLSYANFLKWDDNYSNTVRIVELLERITALGVDEERAGKAALMITVEYRQYSRRHQKSVEDLLTAYRSVVEKYPSSQSAPAAQLALAEYFHRDDSFITAIKEFQVIIDRWPQSREAVRAKQQIAEIKAPRLELFVEEVFRPGGEASLQVRYRNIKKIEFAAHRFDLLSNFHELKTLDRIHTAVDVERSSPEASWTFDSQDKGEHRWYSAKIVVPLSEVGAFIVRGSGAGVTNRALLLISGLATVVKVVNDSVLVYCADALSGEPVGGAQLAAASDYRYDQTILDKFIPYEQRRYYFHNLVEGGTDDSGLWKGEIPKGESSGELLMIARKGQDFAVTESYLSYWYRADTGPKVYIYTDRPVYRPEQEVYYKAIVRGNIDGVYRNRPNQPVQITIKDPRGNTVRTENLHTNAFGTVSGSLMLEESPPLGRWSIGLDFNGEETFSSFRVEEYKKPEFKVEVEPGASQYRLGSRLEATINANYYFGEPVAGAKVEYEVRQNRSVWWYRTPSRYDWLYSSESSYYYGGGRIVHKGEGTTDAEGQLSISLPTRTLPDDDREIKVYDFSISARVTDASRREISGSGGTKVASTEFRAGVSTDRYVYKPGNKVEVALHTSRHDGTALSTKGSLVLYRAQWNKESREYDLEEIWREDTSTNEKGAGKAGFVAEKEGYFFVRYETSGAYDNVIIGSASIWVSGEFFHSKFFEHDGLQIVPDKEHYLLGETARLLINSQLDGVHALLTVEAERVMETRLLVLKQGANLIELPIGEAFEPNVFVKVNAVRGFALYSDEKQLLVPPEEKFATVTIKPSKDSYAPGEKGEVTIEATDWKGLPLDAEFSIGVVDSALYYIAEDETPDIRVFFYGRLRRDTVRTASSFEFSFVGREDKMYAESPMAARSGAVAEEAEADGSALGTADDLVQPEIRKDFRDSALWLAHVRTGADGRATVEVSWPDNLTSWRVTVRSVTTGTVVGSVLGEAITRKDLLVRLQTPRFLVEGDRVTLSVNVHNYLESEKRAKVSIEVEGLELESPSERWVEIGAGEEMRFDVEAIAGKPGTAKVLAKALTDEESDAMELSLPVYVHGAEKFASAAGSVADSREIELNLPAEIRPGSAILKLAVRPTIAGAMLDSLPYLIDYPYGCTEQTMSRFMPAAMVAKTLRDLGLSRPELEEKLPKVIEAGLKRLYDFQHDDGGWGWWKHDDSQVYMTAYVVYGLSVAGQAGIEIEEARLRRAVQYLRRSLPELEDEVELLNYVVFALSWGGHVPEPFLNRVYDLLPKMRAYETALFAVSLHNMGKSERFAAVMKQLEERADINQEQGIVSWGKPGGWYWYQDNVEATALALMAELRRDSGSDYVSGAVRWLLSMRKGSKWKSTRDTAFAIYALTDFLKTSGEFDPDMTVVIEVDGRAVKTVNFSRDNLFSDDGVLVLEGADLKPGSQHLRIVKKGRGNLYFDAFLSYFSLEEHLTASSTTVYIERSYSRILRSVDGRGREVINRIPLKEGDPLRSGDEIEVRLKLKSDNNYEYLVYEDFKPAGCEPTQLRSGYAYGSIASNLELRDEKVVFFIGWLPKGEHEISYNLRAEIPGRFHALPTNGYAMYAPDIRATSDEFVMRIKE